MTIIKATPEEKIEYQKTNPVYPLYGWAISKKENYKLAIEYLGEGPGQPNYEVIAPDGYSWLEEHTLLCFDLKDLRERLTGNSLRKCDCEECHAERIASLPDAPKEVYDLLDGLIEGKS